MKQNQMNQNEYLIWIKTRHSDAALWSRDKCVAADNLIRQTTLDNFKRYLNRKVEPASLRDYVYNTARVHFGSIETDSLMMDLNMYPDWMERSQ